MTFLSSEYVRASLVEINELQESIYKDAMKLPQMSTEQQYEHISKLETLIEKQKIMYTRVCLSDDPEALQIKENIQQAALMMGVPDTVDAGTLFDEMYKTVNHLKKTLGERLDND